MSALTYNTLATGRRADTGGEVTGRVVTAHPGSVATGGQPVVTLHLGGNRFAVCYGAQPCDGGASATPEQVEAWLREVRVARAALDRARSHVVGDLDLADLVDDEYRSLGLLIENAENL